MGLSTEFSSCTFLENQIDTDRTKRYLRNNNVSLCLQSHELLVTEQNCVQIILQQKAVAPTSRLVGPDAVPLLIFRWVTAPVSSAVKQTCTKNDATS